MTPQRCDPVFICRQSGPVLDERASSAKGPRAFLVRSWRAGASCIAATPSFVSMHLSDLCLSLAMRRSWPLQHVRSSRMSVSCAPASAVRRRWCVYARRSAYANTSAFILPDAIIARDVLLDTNGEPPRSANRGGHEPKVAVTHDKQWIVTLQLKLSRFHDCCC